MDDLLRYFLHLDDELVRMIAMYGNWTYGLLAVVIFLETGLVVTPFLPGDSLLFAAGAVSAAGALNPLILVLILFLASVLGDSSNYWIGHWLGEAAVQRWPRVFKPEYLKRTHEFYARYGGRTVVLARFAPIVRTFAPFVAGVGRMPYLTFLSYSVFGSALWVGLLVLAGYLFGNLAVVRDNLTVALIIVVALSMLPALVEYLRHRSR